MITDFEARRSTLAMEWESLDPDKASPDWFPIATQLLQQLKELAPNPVTFYKLSEIFKTLNYDQFQELFIKSAPELWEVASMSFLKLGTGPSLQLFSDFMKYNGASWGVQKDTIEYLLRTFDLSPALFDILEVKYYSQHHMVIK